MKEFRVLALAKKPRPYTPLECEHMNPKPVFTVTSATRREFLTMMAESEINIPKEAFDTAAAEGGDAAAVEIMSQMSDDNVWNTVLNSHDFNIKILEEKLSGWSNVPDTEGDQLLFEKANIEYLSDELIADLVREVTGQPRQEEEKKSEKESSLSSGSETARVETSGNALSAEAKSSIEPGTVKETEGQQE